MELTRRRWEEYILPVSLGVIGGIALGLFAPSFAVNAYNTTAGFDAAMEQAMASTLSRLSGVAQGNISDIGAWAFPLVGALVGGFFQYVRGEPEI